MEYEHLIVEKRDRIYYVTLNRPERMNAMAPQTFTEIERVCQEFNGDPEGYVMIVSGAGERAFCTGMDLKILAEEGRPYNYEEFQDWSRYGFAQADKPVIAAIHGYCLAGGMEMALTCDIRIAAEEATFGMPEPKVGLAPAAALMYLHRVIPLGEAMYILLTGERISAQEAHRIGFVHQLVPRQDLMGAATAIAQQIAGCAPLAIKAIKQVVRYTRYVPPELAAHLQPAILAPVSRSEDAVEGPRAFAEKRKPVWKGK